MLLLLVSDGVFNVDCISGKLQAVVHNYNAILNYHFAYCKHDIGLHNSNAMLDYHFVCLKYASGLCD